MSLTRALGRGDVRICPVVYAELAPQFAQPSDLDLFLDDLSIRLDGFSRTALFEAGAAWRRYARGRGQYVECSRCGHRHDVACPSCRGQFAWRQHLIPDFLIGAHAANQADALLTRDPGYYQTYYPTLTLEIPESVPSEPDHS